MMKPLMLTTAVALITWQGYGQGTILFANTTTTRIIDWRTQQPVDPGFLTVGLYAGLAGSTEDQLELVATTAISPLSFLKGVFSGGIVTLDGITETAAFQVKAWSNTFATFEDAFISGRGDVCLGQSDLLTTRLGGGIIPAGDIVSDGGFGGFSVCIPEPSTITLCFLGFLGATVLIRRRPRPWRDEESKVIQKP